MSLVQLETFKHPKEIWANRGNWSCLPNGPRLKFTFIWATMASDQIHGTPNNKVFPMQTYINKCTLNNDILSPSLYQKVCPQLYFLEGLEVTHGKG